MPLVRFYFDGRRIRSQTPSSTNRKRRRGRPGAFDNGALDYPTLASIGTRDEYPDQEHA